MIEVGDTVRVIDKADIADEFGRRELYPIGTICKVMEVDEDPDGFYFRVVILEESSHASAYSGYWYKKNELEKGRLEWVKD